MVNTTEKMNEPGDKGPRRVMVGHQLSRLVLVRPSPYRFRTSNGRRLISACEASSGLITDRRGKTRSGAVAVAVGAARNLYYANPVVYGAVNERYDGCIPIKGGAV